MVEEDSEKGVELVDNLVIIAIIKPNIIKFNILMPYQTQWEHTGIYWKYTGIVTDNDIIQPNTEFYADPRSDNCIYQIVDGIEIDKFENNAYTLEILASMDLSASRSVKPLKIAFIAVNKDVINFFQAYINHIQEFECKWSCKVFKDLYLARSWISIDSSH